jgi:putative phosphoribosyl transferase
MQPMNRSSGFLRRTATRSFGDRREAGRAVAEQLTRYRNRSDVLVFGLARGGVPVAWEIAAALRAPLDVFLVRKLGVPNWSELAMGALASGGGVVMNEDVVSGLHVTDQQLRDVIDSEKAELLRREHAYRGGRPIADLRDKVVILADDGIATGASMLAAVRAMRAGRLGSTPKSIIVAVPVGPESTCRELAQEADDVVCVTMPPGFEAVGQVYGDFHQVTDDEVRELLNTPTG